MTFWVYRAVSLYHLEILSKNVTPFQAFFKEQVLTQQHLGSNCLIVLRIRPISIKNVQYKNKEVTNYIT